jgi:hypothetical protein
MACFELAGWGNAKVSGAINFLPAFKKDYRYLYLLTADGEALITLSALRRHTNAWTCLCLIDALALLGRARSIGTIGSGRTMCWSHSPSSCTVRKR